MSATTRNTGKTFNLPISPFTGLIIKAWVSLIVSAIAGAVGTTNPSTNFLGMEFVSIAPGTFTMVSPTDELGMLIIRMLRLIRLRKRILMPLVYMI